MDETEQALEAGLARKEVSKAVLLQEVQAERAKNPPTSQETATLRESLETDAIRDYSRHLVELSELIDKAKLADAALARCVEDALQEGQVGGVSNDIRSSPSLPAL
jgi:hypothetical protein